MHEQERVEEGRVHDADPLKETHTGDHAGNGVRPDHVPGVGTNGGPADEDDYQCTDFVNDR